MSGEQFSIEVRKKQDFTILVPLVKELTFKNSKEFLGKAKMELEDTGARAILSLENVEIIDSMSLGTLVAILKHVRKLGGDLVITNLAEPIKVLFSLLNFNTVFKVFSTVDEAMGKFDKG